MNPAIAIVGIGETPPARRSEKDLKTLVIDACQQALDDAGIDAAEVDGIVTDSGLMPLTVGRDYVASQLGIQRRWDAALSYGAAAHCCAPLLAQSAINAGLAKTVLYYFGVDWGTRTGGPYIFHNIYPAKMAFEKPYGFNSQPIYFGFWARRFMHKHHLDESALATVAVTQREHALLNGNAQMKKPLSFDDYYASRMVAEPLRVADCCLITDGAGAYIMTSEERARDCAKPPVKVMGAGFSGPPLSGDDAFTQYADYSGIPGAREATEAALQQAGITLDDVDFTEIYDCSSISCLMQLADIGFCRRDEVGDFVKDGNIGLQGKLPVNTHGGLMSYSYRLGIEHVTETVRQLRGEASAAQLNNAEIGLIGGLSIPEYGVLILGK